MEEPTNRSALRTSRVCGMTMLNMYCTTVGSTTITSRNTRTYTPSFHLYLHESKT